MKRSKGAHFSHLVGYSHPGGGILKNKYGTTNFQEFVKKCKYDVEQARYQLYQEPLPDQFNTSYLLHIHRRLFLNTFEWAGRPRNDHFEFSDGSIAPVYQIAMSESGIPCVRCEEIDEHLKKIDQLLEKSNYFRGLSREEFVKNAAKVWHSLNCMHLFVAGNQHTQEVFLEKLAESAGYSFDFSLITKAHADIVGRIAAKHNDLNPMIEALNDVSDQKKVPILKEFMNGVQSIIGDDIHNHIIVSANKGRTYHGTYLDVSESSFAVKIGDTFVVSYKDDLATRQLKTLRHGDELTYTAVMSEDMENVLIPAEEVDPLTKEEISEMLQKDAAIQTAEECVQHYAQRVYGSSDALKNQLMKINTTPSLGNILQDQILRSPSSVHKLAGFTFCGIANARYQDAERNVFNLAEAVENYCGAVRYVTREIAKEHEEEKMRCMVRVNVPSNELQDVLSLPHKMRQESLRRYSNLQKELVDFIKQVDTRLSDKEKRSVKNKNHKELAKSLGVSPHRANKIIKAIQQARDAYLQRQIQIPQYRGIQKVMTAKI
ncbi:BID domain-containing T4SS effector [Bartonella sp. CB178]|uniref:BID domain-containing T4SS effector n=1 Tax=Bartonella sp. CB178 TaxID=3112255 RepID=UPI00300E6384